MATKAYRTFRVEVEGKPVQVTRAKSAEQAANNVRWRMRVPPRAIRRIVEVKS